MNDQTLVIRITTKLCFLIKNLNKQDGIAKKSGSSKGRCIQKGRIARRAGSTKRQILQKGQYRQKGVDGLTIVCEGEAGSPKMAQWAEQKGVAGLPKGARSANKF